MFYIFVGMLSLAKKGIHFLFSCTVQVMALFIETIVEWHL